MESHKPYIDSDRVNLVGHDRGDLERLLVSFGEKPFRASQLMKWIHQQGVSDFMAMTNLSKQLRGELSDRATLVRPEIVSDRVSPDGTRKWLLRLADGNCIESVFIPETGRGTLCVSSQVGCGLNCSFCATARQGFNRNLETHEIVAQLRLANDLLRTADNERPVSNVVMMGMGEPLLNYSNVVRAMALMQDDFAYGLSKRRVTLSTSGLIPEMRRLSTDCPVSLAVSLHAANDALRDQLVPINRRYPINELLWACRDYLRGLPHQRVTFEYVMLDGVNDRDEDARQLARLLGDVPCKLNLIPFNPFADCGFERSPQARIDRFRDLLMRKGIMTITRKTRGDEIDAACGQLAGQFTDRTRRSLRLGVGDGQ